MSAIGLSRSDSSRAGHLLLGGWAVTAAINLVLMYFFPGKETIPFHLVWIGLSLIYGFTRWHPLGMAAVLGAVAVTTGYILVHHAQLGEIGWEETTEVPLMSAVFGVMVWHVHHRQQALAQVARLAEMERRRAEMQQLFVRFASHELRTPITVARGYTELVRSGSSDPGVAEDTDIVLDELDKLARITYRLVTLMQLDEPSVRISADVDVELARIVRRWEPTADRKWTVRSTVGDVWINPDRLEAALDCLLENAVKFTVDGDRIEVVGAAQGNVWTIEVIDSGVGLSAEHAATLMGAVAPLPTTSGTGLGLAIVRAVVESWDGRVTLAGEPGVGATVTLSFPRQQATSAAEASRAAA
jgi:two-component system OmpR family sensor kinase